MTDQPESITRSRGFRLQKPVGPTRGCRWVDCQVEGDHEHPSRFEWVNPGDPGAGTVVVLVQANGTVTVSEPVMAQLLTDAGWERHPMDRPEEGEPMTHLTEPLAADDVDRAFADRLADALVAAMCKADTGSDNARAKEVRWHMRTALAAIGIDGREMDDRQAEEDRANENATTPTQRSTTVNINSDGSVTTNLAGTTPVFTAEHTSDAWGRRQVTLTLATTMANTRLASRPPVPVLHAKVNAVDLRDLAASLIEAADEADRLDADMTPRLGPCQVCTPIAEAATSALAERVRVVEGERDQLLRERDNIGCSRFTCASNLDNMRARTESAEAAHANLRAGVEALADEWALVQTHAYQGHATRLRALLVGTTP